jgi:hypothetical protein
MKECGSFRQGMAESSDRDVIPTPSMGPGFMRHVPMPQPLGAARANRRSCRFVRHKFAGSEFGRAWRGPKGELKRAPRLKRRDKPHGRGEQSMPERRESFVTFSVYGGFGRLHAIALSFYYGKWHKLRKNIC